MKAIDFELIEEESRQNENRRFLSGITRSYPNVTAASADQKSKRLSKLFVIHKMLQ